MPYVLIQHSVAKYAAFEPVFRDDEARRRRSVENARKFAESYELREAVEWASDSTPPRVSVIELVMDTDA